MKTPERHNPVPNRVPGKQTEKKIHVELQLRLSVTPDQYRLADGIDELLVLYAGLQRPIPRRPDGMSRSPHLRVSHGPLDGRQLFDLSLTVYCTQAYQL
jgi:hypothetical protein